MLENHILKETSSDFSVTVDHEFYGASASLLGGLTFWLRVEFADNYGSVESALIYTIAEPAFSATLIDCYGSLKIASGWLPYTNFQIHLQKSGRCKLPLPCGSASAMFQQHETRRLS